jgi:hypothetical protein
MRAPIDHYLMTLTPPTATAVNRAPVTYTPNGIVADTPKAKGRALPSDVARDQDQPRIAVNIGRTPKTLSYQEIPTEQPTALRRRRHG